MKRRLFDELVEAIDDINQWRRQDYPENLQGGTDPETGGYAGDDQGDAGKASSVRSPLLAEKFQLKAIALSGETVRR